MTFGVGNRIGSVAHVVCFPALLETAYLCPLSSRISVLLAAISG